MRAILIGLLALTFATPTAFAADRRKPELDDCSRRTTQCEAQCDTLNGMERLSCKTDCRLAETQCRSTRR